MISEVENIMVNKEVEQLFKEMLSNTKVLQADVNDHKKLKQIKDNIALLQKIDEMVIE